MRWRSAIVGAGFAAAIAAAHADERDYNYVPRDGSPSRMIDGPKCLSMQDLIGFAQCDPSSHQDFLDAVRHWRMERRIYVGYAGTRYDAPGQQWMQSAFLQPLMMVEDRTLYDPAAGKYTVDRYLDDLNRRYGGIDQVIVWPTYPNLGIDNRNQLDMIAAMPGGLAGVKTMVADFHRRGVKVLFPINMWDQGTRDPGKPWPEAVAETMAAIDADGIFGDTQDGVPLAFPLAAERAGHAMAFQTELSPNDEAVAWNLSSWWQEAPSVYEQFAPKIDRYKWLEPRHTATVAERWSRDKTDMLQAAFFNGIGVGSWENIFGFWNGLTAHDAEMLRRIAALERGTAPFLVSPDWEPFYPMRNFGIFASHWPLKDAALWAIVNRNEFTVEGQQMAVPFRPGARYFDLYRGIELQGRRDGDKLVLNFPMEARGLGAVLETAGPPGPTMTASMDKMKAMTAQPLAKFSKDWQPLPQHQTTIAPTKPFAAAPQNMVEIPGGEFEFAVQGIEVEGGDAAGVDVAYPWEDTARRFHRHRVTVKRFYIDRHNVTNAEFKIFLDATHYHPKDNLNFLKDWENGAYPQGWDARPVTWISLEDARAYAAWTGKRLPHEWEWQYAAQGSDGRVYPWGNDWRPEAVPAPEKSRGLRGPDVTTSHPAGASPFGVLDLAGNVWQWTDEYVDDHTRAAILRGGSYYQPQGSLWYFPQAYRNDQHGKYLLMAPGKDRSATVGFRCVADASN
ncbi:MAG TPA: SUMF1/EgtB/PvdO family nonheme iron enzyme [Rhizomicrobium sp.]|nr:SUMF1/EgtB/PvdO family nonheme iron enzyme [Rhizomicrobium sp.]